MQRFKAYVARKDEGGMRVAIEEMGLDDLMPGQVTVRVDYSTVNYKDALGLTGKGKIFRSFPMIAGIDLAGEVVQSDSDAFRPGDQVVLNGFGLGEVHYGAYAGLARVSAEWLIPLPEGLSPRQAMCLGTAGYTAALCVNTLRDDGLVPDQGPVLVTGATGGVGSVAVALLSRLGHEVVALTGKTDEADYLKGLGAADILDRAEMSEPAKPLARETWAGAVDTCASHILANTLSQMRYGGRVAATGLAMGMDLPASVAPFILRGVRLLGVDSVYRPLADRRRAWAMLAEMLPGEVIEGMVEEIGFEDIARAAENLAEGRMKGRYVVNMKGAQL